MIMDQELMLMDNAAVTGATSVNGSEIDLGPIDPGAGEELWLNVLVRTTLSGNSVSTLSVILQDDTATGMASAATHDTVVMPAITAGTRKSIRISPGCNRFIRARTVADQIPTAGKLDVFITKDAPYHEHKAKNYAVGQ